MGAIREQWLRSANEATEGDQTRSVLMTNPFDDPDGTYLVLVNDERQHSLWPAFVDVPAGWRIAHDRDGRQECIEYVNEHWTDMRPASLVRAMETSAP